MLSALKELFETFTHAPGQTPVERAQALQLATAVLMVEVVRCDGEMGDEERRTVQHQLHRVLALPGAALPELIARAEVAAKTAYDYQHFTSTLNDQLTQPQKIALVEDLWTVAYADTRLDANEHHVISKLASLMYVTHGEYIGAKMRAKEAAGLT